MGLGQPQIPDAIAEDDGIHCNDHPLHNNLTGICSLCLQDKLGKLISSSSSSSNSNSILPLPSPPSLPLSSPPKPNPKPPQTPKKPTRRFWSFFRKSKKVVESSDASPTLNPDPGPSKVARSRSVGCGSRSFSSLGDCGLRRAESHRESDSDPKRNRVRCGGIFGGIGVMPIDFGSCSGRLSTPRCRSKGWSWALRSMSRSGAVGSSAHANV